MKALEKGFPLIVNFLRFEFGKIVKISDIKTCGSFSRIVRQIFLDLYSAHFLQNLRIFFLFFRLPADRLSEIAETK